MNHTIALDAGNYQLKVCDSSATPRAIRSVQYRLPRGVNPLKPLKNSPLIELEDGTRWHVGHQAFKYASQEQTVTQDKALLAKLHFYAVLEQVEGEVNLVVSHHSPDVYAPTLIKSLKGKHSFTRNGRAIDLTVRSVEVVREGLGAYWAAQRTGFIPETGYTIVIDLGGSSWLYRVIDADGDVIAEEVGDRFGSYHLAKQIAADDRLKTPLRRFGITSPDPGIILDGFGRCHAYAETGITWSDWLPEYLDPWFKSILGTVKSACTPHLPMTRRFIVCGGAAHLVESRMKNQQPFVVMPHPEFANVLGMYAQYATAQLTAAA